MERRRVSLWKSTQDSSGVKGKEPTGKADICLLFHLNSFKSRNSSSNPVLLTSVIVDKKRQEWSDGMTWLSSATLRRLSSSFHLFIVASISLGRRHI